MCSFSTCIVNQSVHGLCRTSVGSSNRRRSPGDNLERRWHLGRTITCSELPCGRGWERCRKRKLSCLSSVSLMQHHQSTVGLTILDRSRTVCQAEGGEQGDPLVPLLFYSGQPKRPRRSGTFTRPWKAVVRVLGRHLSVVPTR